MEGSSTMRPLLPKDEDEINTQFSTHHRISPEQPSSQEHLNRHHLISLASRSTSNSNIASILSHKKTTIPVEKALTDTNNFIQMYNQQQQRDMLREVPSRENILTSDEKEDHAEGDDDQISLGSIDNSIAAIATTIPEGNSHEISLATKLKTQKDEWADRGAAKFVKAVTNPATGQVTRQVIKKGIKDFKFGEVLGDGSYSTVMLATSIESGKRYAVKVLSKEYLIRQKKVKYVNIEKIALQRLNNSRGVVKLFFTFQDESSLYFLLEYAPNGDFLSIMKKYGTLNEECSCYYSAQIIDALHFIHSKGIIHRDIKPENILIDKNMKIKLTDFGTAKILEPIIDKSNANPTYDLLTRSKSFVGTAEYVSPELLNDSYADSRCDIWAFGCILFQMIAGKPPFKATNEYLTFQKVMKIQYAFTAGFPVVIRHLVKQILVKNPNDRPTFAQMKKHLFFKDKNFTDGSVWNDPAPEIQPYKITAKSMQPVPALKETNILGSSNNKKTTISIPKRPPTRVASASSPANQAKDSSSRSASTSKKNNVEKNTSQILENAKNEITNRKTTLPHNRRATSGAASAASAALIKGNGNSNHPSNSNSPSSSKGSEMLLTAPKAPTISKNPSKSEEMPKIITSTSAPVINTHQPTQPRKTSSKRQPSMSKLDIQWSYYLSNIDEHILKVGEVKVAAIRNDLLEKRISRLHGNLLDFNVNGAGRTTLLSQVARSGGEVTGFRSDRNYQYLSEDSFYEKYDVSTTDIAADDNTDVVNDNLTSTHGRSVSSSPAPSTPPLSPTASLSTDDNTHPFAFSDKVKKLFQSNKSDAPLTTLALENFSKRIFLLTSFGTLLILAKRNTSDENTGRNYELCYRIFLPQNGINLKEAMLPNTTESAGSAVIQTPYTSFIFQGTRDMLYAWFFAMDKSMKMANDRSNTRISKGEQQHRDALKAAKLANPPALKEKGSFSSRARSPASSPTIHSTASFKTTPTGSPTMSSARGSRLFETFVSTKEKTGKKQISPVPSSVKLVNGLPSSSLQTSHGLGLHNSKTDSSSRRSSFLSKTVHGGSSRLMGKGERLMKNK